MPSYMRVGRILNAYRLLTRQTGVVGRSVTEACFLTQTFPLVHFGPSNAPGVRDNIVVMKNCKQLNIHL